MNFTFGEINIGDCPPQGSGELLIVAVSVRQYRSRMHTLLRVIVAGLIITVTAPVAVAGTPEPVVYMSADRSTDFTKYRTYSWIPRGDDGVDQANYERAQRSVDRALASRFKQADPGDFAIAISGAPGPRGEYQGSFSGTRSRPSLLVIDIYDTSTKKPFWHGVAHAAPGDLDRSVDRLISYFPPSYGCPTSPQEERFSPCDY